MRSVANWAAMIQVAELLGVGNGEAQIVLRRQVDPGARALTYD